MIDKFKDAFKEEAIELLNNLESTLLDLENDPSNFEAVSAVFRTMHTIKGSSAMFGFDIISHFTHELESIMDLLREGVFLADKKFIDLTLHGRDLISTMLADESQAVKQEASFLVEEFKAHVDFKKREHEESTTQLKELRSNTEHKEAVSTDNNENEDNSSAFTSQSETFRVEFQPNENVFLNGTKPLLLLDEIYNLGTVTVRPLLDSLPCLSEINAETSYLGWELFISTDKGEDAIRDVFIFIEDACKLSIKKISANTEIENGEIPELKKLGQILVERGVTSEEKINAVVSSQKRLGELLVQEKIVSDEDIRSALEEQEHIKRQREKPQSESATASIRVASDKLDELVDLVGELVTLQARLVQTSSTMGDASLSLIAEQLERLVAQLRDNTMSIRMLPIGSTFTRFKRLVRDSARDLGKDIELLTNGAETELDKTVIERLSDPLVHIIRNAVDHGIESPEERKALGKSETGIVSLSAQHSGAHVLIEVSDDGKGLDAEKIQKKAIERGLISATTALSRADLYNLIFMPGFSTASSVSSLSGRGVGMDVVKREIDNLGGSVSLESEPGLGSKIILKIPLTLAIIDGLLVLIGEEYYVIPLSGVDSCTELSREQKGDSSGRTILNYQNEVLPYTSLRNLFQVPGEAPKIEQVVVVNSNEGKVGLLVDQVVGDYQTVIKPLGRMFRQAEGLSGATILGDGTVALILDIHRLAQRASAQEQRGIAATVRPS